MDLHALLATSPIRNIQNSAEKAAVLIDKYNRKSKIIRRVLHVSKDRLKRARKALKKGQMVGMPGRPRMLTKRSEESVVQTIRETRLHGDVVSLDGCLKLVSLNDVDHISQS